MNSYLEEVLHYIEKGGPDIMVSLFLLSVIAWYLILSKLSFVLSLKKEREIFIGYLFDKNIEKKNIIDNMRVYSSLLSSLKKISEVSNKEKYAANIYTEFYYYVYAKTDKGFLLISAVISAAPLLGLLGTVGGMMKTFKTITVFGTDSPSMIADGISMALITTQSGLIVAFPIMFAFILLKNMVKDIKSVLYLDKERVVGKIANKEEFYV